MMIKLFLTFPIRNENKELLRKAMSEEARRNRAHRQKVSLQISILSWMVEFITGALIMLDYLLAISDSDFYDWMCWLVALDVFLCGVVIPSAHVLNTENVKEFLYGSGWMKTFKKLCCKNDSRVSPSA